MDERRKIVIPIGTDSDSKSEQTFFDTQARNEARPVVPLSKANSTGPASGSRKGLAIIVFLVTALVAAAGAGGYVYFWRDRGPTGPQAAVQPVAGKALTTLSWTHTIEEPRDDESTTDATEQANDAKADQTQARTERAANDGDPKKKQQKRGKSGNKNSNDQSDNPVKNTQDELHRIREIFEGPP